MNTTLAVVATDAGLTRAQAQKLAGTAHDGIARAVRPVHLLNDGDTVFTLATGTHALDPADPLAPNEILAAGADLVTRAIVRAVRAADPVDGPGGAWPSYGELYGGVEGDGRGGEGREGGGPRRAELVAQRLASPPGHTSEVPYDQQQLTSGRAVSGTFRVFRSSFGHTFSRFPDMMSDRGATVCTHKVTCSNAGRNLERSVRDGSVRTT